MSLADAVSIQKLLNSTTFYWVGLAVALVIMAVVIHALRNWYRDRDDPADADDKMVRELEELKRRGDLSDEEFRSIKGQVSSRRVRLNQQVEMVSRQNE